MRYGIFPIVFASREGKVVLQLDPGSQFAEVSGDLLP